MAVTCDAGNGCTIECDGGSCWAIYSHASGRCLSGCGDNPASVDRVANALAPTDAINVRINGIPKNRVYQVLHRIVGRAPAHELEDATPITFERDFITPAALYELLDFDNKGVPPEIEPPPFRRDNHPD